MSHPLPHILVMLAALVPVAGAQNQVYVPDNNAGAGTCNSYPWNQASFTYVSRVPASFMDPQNPMVEDVWFAPCNSGTWSAPDVQIALGHVPNPVPNPFTFPQIAAGSVVSTGSFSDLVVLWDSTGLGAFTWSYTAGTWSALGFAAAGGTGFTWNGTDDVAFYVTMQGASGGSSMHRTSTEPFRFYALGTYQAATSTGSGSSGLKISFTLQPGMIPMANPFGSGCQGSLPMAPSLASTQLPFIGNSGYTLTVGPAPPGALTWIYAAVAPAPSPIPFGGCDILLDPVSTQSLVQIGFSPFGPVPVATVSATYQTPVPNQPTLAGERLYLQGVVEDPGSATGIVLTNGLELAFY